MEKKDIEIIVQNGVNTFFEKLKEKEKKDKISKRNKEIKNLIYAFIIVVIGYYIFCIK